MKSIAVAYAALALVAPAAAGSSVAASLRISSTGPLVQGRHFRPHERVRVTLSVPSLDLQRTRRVTATGAGAFGVNFAALRLGPCLGFTLRAVGSGGSHSLLKRPPLPACMP